MTPCRPPRHRSTGFYTSFTRRDLQEILRTLQDEEKALDERWQPVHAVLSQVSFGSAGSSMRVVRRRETPIGHRDFLRRVEQVTSTVTGEDEAARDLRFRRHLQLMEWPTSDSPAIARERSMALSRAHRAHFDAVVSSSTGDQRRCTGTDSASGGQGQELVSAPLGAALRFPLDGADGVLGYAPVIMDEGFVKADRGVRARAIETLQRLGCQVIMAVPEGKTEDAARAFGSLAQHADTKQSLPTPSPSRPLSPTNVSPRRRRRRPPRSAAMWTTTSSSPKQQPWASTSPQGRTRQSWPEAPATGESGDRAAQSPRCAGGAGPLPGPPMAHLGGSASRPIPQRPP
jgi:hypothetical protein